MQKTHFQISGLRRPGRRAALLAAFCLGGALAGSLPGHGAVYGGGTTTPPTPSATLTDPLEVTCTTLAGGADTVSGTVTAPAGTVWVQWTTSDNTVLSAGPVSIPAGGTQTLTLTQTFPAGTTVLTASVYTSDPAAGGTLLTTSNPVSVIVDTPQSTAGGKVTGGGEIDLGGGKLTFGLVAMVGKDGSVHGNVLFQDHVGGHTVKSTQLTALVVGGTHAQIWGQATVDGQGSYTFIVDVDDRGEPGAGVDGFGITVGSGYAQGELTLTGGNIQLH